MRFTSYLCIFFSFHVIYSQSLDDIDNCQHNFCQNNATCVDGMHSYTCQCQEGFSGVHCETGACVTSNPAYFRTTDPKINSPKKKIVNSSEVFGQLIQLFRTTHTNIWITQPDIYSLNMTEIVRIFISLGIGILCKRKLIKLSWHSKNEWRL